MATHKSMVYDTLSSTRSAAGALLRACKYNCPTNGHGRGGKFESRRPRHSFEKT